MARIIETGKHKGKILADCPETYIIWASKHEKNFSPDNRWVSRDARIILQERAQAVIETAAIEKLEAVASEGNANWDEWEQSMSELEARHEKEMAVKIAEHLVKTPARVDFGLKGNLSSNAGLRLMR